MLIHQELLFIVSRRREYSNYARFPVSSHPARPRERLYVHRCLSIEQWSVFHILGHRYLVCSNTAVTSGRTVTKQTNCNGRCSGSDTSVIFRTAYSSLSVQCLVYCTLASNVQVVSVEALFPLGIVAKK